MGAFAGAVVAVAAAAEMLAANELTINPSSSVVLVLTWALFGAVVGAAVGMVGGRFAIILRRPHASGALALAIMTTGHLLLPTGFGLAMAVLALLMFWFRRKWFPHAARLDVAIAAGVAVAAILVPRDYPALPPLRDASEPLTVGSPLPGSLPVTLTVHTQTDFPEVTAIHLPLRPLVAEEPGRRAALWTGRLPDRTRVGRQWPRAVPGGGGIHRTPPWPGARWLTALFPRVHDPSGTVFEPTGSLPDIAEAAGIPVLRHPPHPDDPPHFLRILEGTESPDPETARSARDAGAWIDVTWTERGGSVALSGHGFVLARTSGHVNLVDLAPTTLHLLGLAIPRSIDGRVLVELLESPGAGDRPPRYAELHASAPAAPDVSEPTTSR